MIFTQDDTKIYCYFNGKRYGDALTNEYWEAMDCDVNRLIKQTYIFGHLPEINISKADCDKI
jgi:hypothetical protein